VRWIMGELSSRLLYSRRVTEGGRSREEATAVELQWCRLCEMETGKGR
jgi:hypothetical protein